MPKKIGSVEKTIYCIFCGEKLTEDNSFIALTESGATLPCICCLNCQAKDFQRFEQDSGSHLALYFNCLKYDLPCFPLLVPPNFGSKEFLSNEAPDGCWIWYITMLLEKEKLVRNGKFFTFSSGITNMLRIFGKDFTEKDFAKYVRFEQERLEKLEGTEAQREKWGTDDLWVDFNMTSEVYDELDRQYENRVSSYKGQSITPQMDDTLVKVCKWNLVINHLFKKGEIKAAKDVQTMVDSVLAAEQMRKKDEKPVEGYRIDAQIKALEDRGLLEDGKFLNLKDTIRTLRDSFVKSRKYDYSLDVADQMIFDFYNNMRANADLFMTGELPEELLAIDEYGEFQTEPSEEETERKKFADLLPIKPKECKTKKS